MKPLSCAPFVLAAALAASPGAPVRAADTTIAEQRAHWSTQAGRPGDAARGEAFFTTRHGGEWSCASCHGTRLDPLAPAANPRAFTDSARVDKWFRRNCRDVLSRECTAAEKADVLAYLDGLGPAGRSGGASR